MSTQRRLKSRPALSCTRCRERKVKCDRVKPCRACCVHGRPRECVYSDDADDRLAIAQADEIERLRKEVTNLRKRLDDAHLDSSLPDDNKSSSSSSSGSGSTSRAASTSSSRSAKRQQLLLRRRNESTFPTGASLFQPSAALTQLWSNFTEEFLDRLCPPGVSGTDDWMRSLAKASWQSELLSDAFSVASFFQCGLNRANGAMEIEGRRMYGKVLNDLQMKLYDRERSIQPDVLYTLLVLSTHEMLYFQHATAFLAHIAGAEKLVEMRVPTELYQGLERETFSHFRVFSLSLGVFRRKRTFLSLPEWKIKRWQQEGSPSDLMEELMDDLVDIPGLFNDADDLLANISTGDVLPQQAEMLRNQYWAKLGDFENRLRKWTERWLDPWPGEHCRPVQEDDRQMVTDIEHFNRSLWYSDMRTARAVCMYAAGRLLLSRVDRRPNRASEDTIEELSMLISDSMNYLLAVTNGYTSAMNMLFPLRVAYFSLPEDSQGRTWIRDVLWNISTRFNMPFALQFLPTLPGKGGHLNIS